MLKKNSKKNSKINLQLNIVPRLGVKNNFEDLESYNEFFNSISPIINYLLDLSSLELDEKLNKLLIKYIKYYFIVFDDYIDNYTKKPDSKIIETYSKICHYVKIQNLSFVNKIKKKYYNSKNIYINKIDTSNISGNILKPCKAGYERNQKTNRCIKKTQIQSTTYYGPFEPPKGMKTGSKRNAIKNNFVCRYGIEKLTENEVKELNKLHNKKK
jgi:hypothetical protein